MLFVVMPPALESAIVSPLIEAEALSLVFTELATILIASLEHEDADAVLQVVSPVTHVEMSTGPVEDAIAVHLVLLPVTLVDAFLVGFLRLNGISVCICARCNWVCSLIEAPLHAAVSIHHVVLPVAFVLFVLMDPRALSVSQAVNKATSELRL